MSDNLKTLFSFTNNEEIRSKLLNSEHRISKSFDTLFSGYSLKAEDVLNEVVISSEKPKDYLKRIIQLSKKQN